MRTKLACIFLGVTLSLVFLETGLRVIGHVHGFQARSRELQTGMARGQLGVLCMGDSFVYGMGASLPESFPQQLELLLRKRKNTVSVYNRGMSGENTYTLLQKLPRCLDWFKPEVLVLLIGGSNQWNLLGFSEYQRPRSLLESGAVFLYHLKIYKFLVLIREQIRTHNDQAIRSLLEQPVSGNGRVCTRVEYPQESVVIKEAGVIGDRSESLFQQGWYYAKRRNYARAIPLFLRGIQRDPWDANNYFGIAQCYLSQDKYRQALAWARNGASRHPRASILYWLVGNIYYHQKDFQNALVWFRKGIQINPCDGRAYSSVGKICLRLGEIDKARVWFLKGSEISPSDPFTQISLGKFYCYIREFDEAMKVYQGLSGQRSMAAARFLGMGLVAQQTGDFEEAMRLFRISLKYNSYNSDVYFAVAKTLFMQNKNTEGAWWVYAGISQGQTTSFGFQDVFFHAYKHTGNKRSILEYLKKMDKNLGKDMMSGQVQASAGDEGKKKILEWVRADVERIISLCKKRGIALILCNYPEKYYGRKHSVSVILKEVALRHNVPIVDNEEAFRALGLESKDYYSHDEHCNAKGYALIARNIYTVLIERYPKLFLADYKDNLINR